MQQQAGLWTTCFCLGQRDDGIVNQMPVRLAIEAAANRCMHFGAPNNRKPFIAVVRIPISMFTAASCLLYPVHNCHALILPLLLLPPSPTHSLPCPALPCHLTTTLAADLGCGSQRQPSIRPRHHNQPPQAPSSCNLPAATPAAAQPARLQCTDMSARCFGGAQQPHSAGDGGLPWPEGAARFD